jgi:DNA-binding NtrC family response regulator
VRELENAIEHAVVFGATAEIRPEDLPEAVIGKAWQSAVPAFNYRSAVRDAKRNIVLDALQQADGDHSAAAKLLDIHATNLYRLIRDLDVKPRARPSKSG